VAQPLVLYFSDGTPFPGPFAKYRSRVTRDSDEACRLVRTERPAAVVVAARPDMATLYLSRLHDSTRQPIIAVTPNEPREAIRAVRAGAYDAAIFGTLESVLDDAVAEGLRVERGEPERLGPFEILELVGRGGMSTVYRAREAGREVALKVLSPELSANQDFVDRFHREAKSAVKLSHPNLMAVYGHGRARWRLWMSMEFVRGRTLDKTLQETGRLSASRSIQLARQIAEGLGYAHQLGFIHRDIKPQNLHVGDDDSVKIMDFGLLKTTSRDATPITRSDEFVGTLLYASPEHIHGDACDGRTDLYALGIVLFEMITGMRPFSQGDSMLLIRAKESNDLPFRVLDLNPSCPQPIAAIIERLIRPNAADRYQTAADVIKAIDALPPL
jgi:serine/threonine-protein kinase